MHLKPGDTFTATLPSHADHDDAATATMRVLSVADHIALHTHLDAARVVEGVAERYAQWGEAIAIGLVSFGDDDDWMQRLTPGEACELLELILSGAQPEGDELGNSAAPQDSDTAVSTAAA